MSLLIGFLTFILVVNCLFLILLILVQLPKKEAGAGLAFGAGAVDTLIGAGSGNALTTMTRYGATTFMALAVLLAVLNAQRSDSTSRNLERALSQKATAAPMLAPPPVAAPTTGALPGAAIQSSGDTLPVVTPTARPAAATNASGPLISPLPNAPAQTEPQPQ
jgi:protein translocase SecG subunit